MKGLSHAAWRCLRPALRGAAHALALAGAALWLPAPTFAAPDAAPAVAPAAPSAAATLTGPLPGVPVTGRPSQMAAAGYIEQEWLLKGSAGSYKVKGKWQDDAQWQVEPRTAPHPYATRLLVRRPADPARFNGIVLVEWMNSALGYDLDGSWILVAEEAVREGYAWVGVTADAGSVEAIKKADAPRYAGLRVDENNGQAYDIYTQALGAVRRMSREWGPAGGHARLLGAGYSQSGSYLITYLNAFLPITKAADGVYLLSTAAIGMSLDKEEDRYFMPPYRTNRATPVMQVSAEMEVMISWYLSHTKDSDALRHWEITGASHLDHYMQTQAMAARLSKEPLPTPQCRKPVSTLPSRLFFQAGLHALREWVVQGKAPPVAPRMERSIWVKPNWGPLRDDEIGNTLGGLRLPDLDVPLAEYDMYWNFPKADWNAWTIYACLAGGSRNPLDADDVRARYASQEVYFNAYKASADKLLNAGFLRPQGHAWLVQQARGVQLPLQQK